MSLPVFVEDEGVNSGGAEVEDVETMVGKRILSSYAESQLGDVGTRGCVSCCQAKFEKALIGLACTNYLPDELW